MTGEAPERGFPGAESPEVLRGYYARPRCISAPRSAGTATPNLGDGATVFGLMAALEERDHLFTTYREHGYALARGARGYGT